MKYMGVVTDKSWHKALLDLYPNRKYGHPDSARRKAMANQKRDLPEMSIIMQNRRSHHID